MSKTTKPATASAKTMTKSPTAPAPEPKTFVAFGGDEHGKPRAARFTDVPLPVLAKAADAMNLRVYEVKGGDLAVFAKRLPAGHLYSSGGASVPYIRGELYSEIVSATVGEPKWDKATLEQNLPKPLVASELPRSWDDLAPGHVVVVQETLESGWWEALVIERNGDFATVKYRDFPEYPDKFVRHRTAVALIAVPPSAPEVTAKA